MQSESLGKISSLDLAMSDGAITAITVKEAGADYESLVDAKVRLRGNEAPLVQSSWCDDRRFTSLSESRPDNSRGACASPPLHVTDLASQRSVALLSRTIFAFTASTFRGRLLWPGLADCFAFRTASQGLCAQTDQTTPLHPGELAEVIGFPIMGAFTPSLTHATYEAAGFQQPVPPVAVTAEQASARRSRRRIGRTGRVSLLGRTNTASDPNIVLSSQTSCFFRCLAGTI